MPSEFLLKLVSLEMSRSVKKTVANPAMGAKRAVILSCNDGSGEFQPTKNLGETTNEGFV